MEKGLAMERGKIRMTIGFAIRAIMEVDGLKTFPSASELHEATKRHPELVPAPGWDLETCEYARTHLDELAEPVGDSHV